MPVLTQERKSLSLEHEEGRKVVNNYTTLLFISLPIRGKTGIMLANYITRGNACSLSGSGKVQ